MPTFKLLKSDVKPLTPEIAARFRDMEPSPTERDLDPARLRNLQEKAEAGHLVTFSWATAKMGDKVMRMNGQHSSNMLCGLNGSFPKGLFVHLDEYEVDGPQGLALLFRQFDDRKSGRTSKDVAGAYQMLEPALHNVAKAVGKLGIDGVAWYRQAVAREPTPTGDQRYSFFNEKGLHTFLIWLNDVFSIKTPEMKNVAVVAAMYATYRANPDEAAKFWDQVARGGVDYEDNAPASVLDNWLKSAKEGDLKEKLKPAQYYQGCIYAWNAFREEKALKDIKADTRKSWLNPIE